VGVFTYDDINTCIHIDVFTDMYIDLSVFIHRYIRITMYVYAIPISGNISTHPLRQYTHTHAHDHAHTDTHTHTHTHKHICTCNNYFGQSFREIEVPLPQTYLKLRCLYTNIFVHAITISGNIFTFSPNPVGGKTFSPNPVE